MALYIQQNQYLLARPPIIENEAARFVEHSLIDARHNSGPVYSQPLDQFVSVEEGSYVQQLGEDLFKKANEELQTLFTLLRQAQVRLQKKSKGKFVGNTDRLKTCSWETVLSEVKETSDQWSMLSGNTRGKRCLEAIGEHSDALQAWISLLPAGDYGAGICGVFALALGAASRYLEVEDAIFDALAEFPELMENAKVYINIYGKTKDHGLIRKTFDLYLAVLKAMNHIMLFFAESSTKKFFGSVVGQSTYKTKLIEALDEVRKQSLGIDKAATMCQASRTANMHKNIVLLGNDFREFRGDIEQLPGRVVDELEERINRVAQSFYKFHQSDPRNVTNGDRLEVPRITASSTDSDALASLLSSSPALSVTSLTDFLQRNAIDAEQKSSKILKKIMSTLKFDAHLVEEDKIQALDDGYKLTSTDAARASAAANHPTFKTWLSETCSSALLVNGNTDMAANEGPSPFSMLCAQLITASQTQNHTFVVYWFGDLHRRAVTLDANDKRVGIVHEMVAYLIGQLALQMKKQAVHVGIDFLPQEEWRNLKTFSLGSLIKLFRNLTLQLPSSALLTVVLDEVSLYEMGRYADDIFTVVKRLQRLLCDDSRVVKLIVTCRCRAMLLRELFSEEEILDMSPDIEGDDRAVWQVRHMKISES